MTDTLVGASPPPRRLEPVDTHDRELSPGELAAVEDLFAGLCTGFDYCARPVRRLASGELAPSWSEREMNYSDRVIPVARGSGSLGGTG